MKQIKGIYLPDSDTHFEYHLMQGPEVFGAGTYQYKKIKKALDTVQATHHCVMRVAVDVGAHVGLWSRILGHYFTDTYAFEPVDEMRDCLIKNVQNCPNTIHYFKSAVSSVHNSMLVMDLVPDNTGNAHVRPPSRGGVIDDKHPVVTTVALDHVMFAGPVNFLKLDVEGYELEVLKGASRILTEDKPIIVLEQKGGNAERYGWGQHDALNYLKQMGYEPVWEMSGDHCVKHKSTV